MEASQVKPTDFLLAILISQTLGSQGKYKRKQVITQFRTAQHARGVLNITSENVNI